MANTIDKDLQAAIKQAKAGRPMRFAYVAKGMEGKLLLGKTITPKETAEAKKEVGGGQVYLGKCVGEDGTLFFEVVKEPPASLAAQIKRRLKEDAGLTLPVEFRTKADAEAEDAAEAPEGAAVPPAPPPPPPEPDAARAALMKRLNGLGAPLKAALAGPQGPRVQALFVSVNGFLKSNDFAQAAKALDELEPLVAAAPAAAPPAAAKEQAKEPAAAGKSSSFVLMQQCRLAWTAAVKKIQADIVTLRTEAHAAYEGEPILDKMDKALGEFIDTLTKHHENLSDKLDEALNAAGADERQKRQGEAIALLQQFQAYADADPILEDIDDNGLVPLQIKKTLAGILPLLASKLGASAATPS